MMILNLATNETAAADQSSLPVVPAVTPAADKNVANARASTDVLVQLRANLSQLEELHARLQFAMSEVSYLIRRD